MDQNTIPRVAVQSIATGLFMMAFFTTFWAIMGHLGLNGRGHCIEIIIFAVLCLLFVITGIYLLLIAKRFPMLSSEEDIAEGKKFGKWFGIIFGAEGLGIFVAVNVVINMGYPNLVVPVIALVVGLHFYPMGWLFKRTIDYYLATWTTLVAICAVVFTLKKMVPDNDILAFTGIGVAIATSCYGLFMMYRGILLAKRS